MALEEVSASRSLGMTWCVTNPPHLPTPFHAPPPKCPFPLLQYVNRSNIHKHRCGCI
uniref:Uncharacterized protein n=1 Tax=Rhizophora mucronata TaxID=61149 RepID=A0A2P2QXG8_RHIMU